MHIWVCALQETKLAETGERAQREIAAVQAEALQSSTYLKRIVSPASCASINLILQSSVPCQRNAKSSSNLFASVLVRMRGWLSQASFRWLRHQKGSSLLKSWTSLYVFNYHKVWNWSYEVKQWCGGTHQEGVLPRQRFFMRQLTISRRGWGGGGSHAFQVMWSSYTFWFLLIGCKAGAAEKAIAVPVPIWKSACSHAAGEGITSWSGRC